MQKMTCDRCGKELNANINPEIPEPIHRGRITVANITIADGELCTDCAGIVTKGANHKEEGIFRAFVQAVFPMPLKEASTQPAKDIAQDALDGSKEDTAQASSSHQD